ncbi:bacteriocin immunity protein [Pseudomonas moraviensis subsp. stanleyae]|uniref:bacteriocin immunity protein n=1 Tax=Pseudomonas moraviensis TaxID=321662 RepID=UPI002E30DD71|nr:bacteriocin immunity protein [Pseudomonas moraviensis]MED7667436.1 bacteriocin immunity protein [Pseudomonas moraviensis subsp. stanleyae]
MANETPGYTEKYFSGLLERIFAANRNGTPEVVLADMLDNFCELAEHPAGTDLIYWPEDETQCTPEGITATVKKWRADHGLPGFKQ